MSDKSKFVDEIRIEGINYKGFGIIPKLVMFDTNLSIESKGIYAYFCSFAGSGRTAFPGRDLILADLHITKDTYYEHQRPLIDAGYLSVEQKNFGGQGSGFQKNLYTLNSTGFSHLNDVSAEERDYLSHEGIRAFGYGTIPKSIMQDPRLSLCSKALYAFYCSCAGAGKTAVPKKDYILHYLGISDKSFRKYKAALVDTGYIKEIQNKEKGKFGSSSIYIIENPDIGDKDNLPCGNISDTQIQDTLISDTQESDALNQDTNINRQKINSLKKEQSINHSIDSSSPDEKNERGIDEILFDLSLNKCIPEDYLSHKEWIKASVNLLCDTSEHEKALGNKTPEEYKAFTKLFKNALISLLTEEKGVYEGIIFSNEEVRQEVSKYIITDWATGKPTLSDLINRCKEAYKDASELTQPKYPKKFCKRIIWNVLSGEDYKA